MATSETQASESRIIGKLEGAHEALQKSIERVLDGQEAARVEMKMHVAEDRTYQERFAEGLGGLRDRVVRLEMGADASEGHGSAIVDLETRMSAREAINIIHSTSIGENGSAIVDLTKRMAVRESEATLMQPCGRTT